MMVYKTEQEEFWAGEFGDSYIERNNSSNCLSYSVGIFSKILSCIPGERIRTCLELGSNIGLNLRALHLLIPELMSSAVEINAKAAMECSKIPNNNVYNESILTFSSDIQFDLTFTAGVLIHINPNMLKNVYEILYNNSSRYVLIHEYYNPTPVEVTYRGNKGRLFKRDFAGEFMDLYPGVKLINYGFVYHRDKNFPSDDSTWFLMEK